MYWVYHTHWIMRIWDDMHEHKMWDGLRQELALLKQNSRMGSTIFLFLLWAYWIELLFFTVDFYRQCHCLPIFSKNYSFLLNLEWFLVFFFLFFPSLIPHREGVFQSNHRNYAETRINISKITVLHSKKHHENIGKPIFLSFITRALALSSPLNNDE